MKKRILALLTAATVMMSLCGCGIDVSMKFKENGTGTCTAGFYLSEDEMKAIAGEDADTSDFKKMTKDGVTYYYEEENEKFDKDEVASSFAHFDSKYAVMSMQEAMDNESIATLTGGMTEDELKEMIQFIDTSITFPYKIVKSNLPVSKDGKTVKINMDTKFTGDYAYVIFDKSVISKKNINTNVKNKTYTKPVAMKINTDGVINSVSIKRDGKKWKQSYSSLELQKKTIHNGYDKLYFDKDGSYTVTVKLINGAKKTYKFKVQIKQ